MSWKASLLWSLGWLSRAVSRITVGCSFILLTPSPFCGRLNGNRGWLLSRLASQETFPAFFTKRLFKEQDVQLNLRLRPGVTSTHTWGKTFLPASHVQKAHWFFFFKSGIEEKGGREGKWKEREGGRAMGSMWGNQMPTPWSGRQRHSLLPCSLTVLKNSREGDNTPGKWSV